MDVGRIPPQSGIYPARLAPDAPLVLAVPGLRIPALNVSQEQHFGFLVGMLAERGIPCRILIYDTRENPLAREAALFSPALSIAWTRVAPAAVRELEFENERRAVLGLPPVRRIVFFGYSQGGVIVTQLASRIFNSFRIDYERFAKMFGGEWRALMEDPEFKYFINALDDYLVLKNIMVQRPGDFERDPDLRHFYERAEVRASRQFDEFIEYVLDPSRRFPEVKRFEGPESPFYPKRYRALRLCASSLEHCPLAERERIRQFFMDYAEYRAMLEVEPSFVTTAASFFGSPRANETLALFRWFPWLKLFLGSELNQLRETELGAPHQIEGIEWLVRLQRAGRYPLGSENSLFILGANGDSGDGLVDQSSAHLSGHAYERVQLRRSGSQGGAAQARTVERDRLPCLAVVPLRVTHFPERALWGLGWKRYGAAYMTEGNPVFPFLLRFIDGDWPAVYSALQRDEVRLMQFMLSVTWREGTIASARHAWNSPDISIDGRYDNPQKSTVVWTGRFHVPGEAMNLVGSDRFRGSVGVELRTPGGNSALITCSVYPGRNTFVRLE